MEETPENVIHVDFAHRGVRAPLAAGEGVSATAKRMALVRTRDAEDPVTDLYTADCVARLFNISVGRLRYWDRTSFLSPSGKRHHQRAYTFGDLISIRTACGLLEAGLPLQKVRRSLSALRKSLPGVTRPLTELKVTTDGKHVLVRDRQGAFEPQSGQQLLDFDVDSLRDQVIKTLDRSRTRTREANSRAAYHHYLEGCRLDEDPRTVPDAEAAYKRALELDPDFTNAMTNLGNLKYSQSDVVGALELFEKALRKEPAHPEALYNVGFIMYEQGEVEHAADCFLRAIESDPAFADAHFNAAMTLEDLGQGKEARLHWRAYLELDPDGPWADIAAEHLH